jgi:hypothetical protein
MAWEAFMTRPWGLPVEVEKTGKNQVYAVIRRC